MCHNNQPPFTSEGGLHLGVKDASYGGATWLIDLKKGDRVVVLSPPDVDAEEFREYNMYKFVGHTATIAYTDNSGYPYLLKFDDYPKEDFWFREHWVESVDIIGDMPELDDFLSGFGGAAE